MQKTFRTVVGLAIALTITVATAVPVGGYGLEKAPTTKTSLSVSK